MSHCEIPFARLTMHAPSANAPRRVRARFAPSRKELCLRVQPLALSACSLIAFVRACHTLSLACGSAERASE